MCLNPPSETVILSVGWAWGPPKVMKNASVRQPLSMEPLPFPCHPDRSEAERRDLRFYGPVLEMFFDGVNCIVLLSTPRDVQRVGPATTLYGTVALSLSSRPERSGAEGPAVLRTRPGNVFRRSEAPHTSVAITEGFMARSRRACPERSRRNPRGCFSYPCCSELF